ncbi:MAG: cytochrome c3 family protein, partial [Acidimicrobiia bacterium]
TNNLSHFVNDGCFRCHGGDQVNELGEPVTAACDSCHVIVAQGPTDVVAELDSNVAGLGFQHPVEIGNAWQTINCTQCHNRESGY